MKSKKPAWLPDWRDKEAYPQPGEDMTGARWAWEFLRRNPKYQADYERLKQERERSATMWRTLPEKDGRGIRKRRPETWPWHLRQADSRIDQIIKKMRTDYGLSDGPVPPSPSAFRQGPIEPIFAMASMLYYGSTERRGPHERLLKFDLTLPIERQLRRAREILRIEQYPRKADDIRHREDLFPEYLRLLDAKQAGATQDEMSRVLYPKIENRHPDFNGRDRVKKALKAATRLRDRDYKLLVLA